MNGVEIAFRSVSEEDISKALRITADYIEEHQLDRLSIWDITTAYNASTKLWTITLYYDNE